MALSPAQRKTRAQIAAFSRVAQPEYDGRQATAAATSAYWARYEFEVDPEGKLNPEQRRQKAKAAWSSDMARKRLQVSKKPRRKSTTKTEH